MKKFEGKVVSVTGAGHGIGKQIVVQLTGQGVDIVIAGYNVESDTETAEEITCDYVESLFVQMDMSKLEDMDHTWGKILEESGRTDTLVLNAGMALKRKVNEFTFEKRSRAISINLSGLFNAAKAFYNDFPTNHGSIVYVSSGSTLNGTGGVVAHPAPKAGGEGLTHGLTEGLGPEGADVNIIASRLTDTGDMIRIDYPAQVGLDAVLEKVPVRRYGTVRDVANLAVSLADKDNSYIQGQTTLLNGGRTIA